MFNLKLHVGNLPFSTTEAQLVELFEPYGEVLNVNLVSDRESGRSRGFAFVTLQRDKGFQALEALDGRQLGDRRLRVTEARPPHERDRSFAGGRKR